MYDSVLFNAELAAVLRGLWACRFVHRDPKAANIRVQVPPDDPTKAKIILVDVNGVHRPLWASRKFLLQSIGRLDASLATSQAVTRTDRLRLLLTVLRGIDRTRTDWKTAFRQVERFRYAAQTRKAKYLPWLQPTYKTNTAQ